MIGETLSHFRIEAKLGAGGMGVVYRAFDLRLEREVAVKLLPGRFDIDPERRARFEREAKLLAALRHPRIAGIHELGEAEVRGSAITFLVMELVLGETLANRLAAAPMTAKEAVAIARQIAEALEAAHDRGIVHRDLKPANIKVDAGPEVKILDFGLAKMLATAETSPELSDAPTLDEPMTRTGVVLGTVDYMSPEQARGLEVDRRADVWAFGCVLFEMLAGRRPFPGATPSDVLARILEREPDWEALPDDLPLALRRLLRRCLAKDPGRRLRDLGDARLEMEELDAEPDDLSHLERRGVGASTWSRPLVVGLAAALLAAVVTWVLVAPEPPRTQSPRGLALRLDHPIDAIDIQAQLSPLLALAPDGSVLAFVGRHEEASRIYLTNLDGTGTEAVPDTDGALAPFFSPDGASLGFVDGDDLKAVPRQGGPAITLGSAQSRSRASWTPGGEVLFAGWDGVYLTGLDGGEPDQIAKAEAGRHLKHPVALPGGRAVLFASTGILLDDASRIEILDLDSRERRVLVERGGTPAFVPASGDSRGYLVYGLEGRLFAAPMDLDELRLTSAAVAVVDDVLMRPSGDHAQYSFSSTGVLVYAPERGLRELVWVDDAGRAQPLSGRQRPFAMPRLSPDGALLALEVHEVPHQIWILDIEKDLLSRFTFDDSNHNFAWLPDGRSILYTSDSGDGLKLLWRRVDSPGQPVTVYSGSAAWICSLSRDGKLATVHGRSVYDPDHDGPLETAGEAADAEGVAERSSYNVFLLPLDGASPPRLTGPPIPVATSRFDERDGWISPDGRCVAYVGWEGGHSEIYVTCLNEGIRRQISAAGGREPLWSKSGGEIYYRSGRRLMVVEVGREPGFRAGAPRVVSEGDYSHFDPANYDVTADGRWFVRLRSATLSNTGYLAIHLDWFQELQARVGTEDH